MVTVASYLYEIKLKNRYRKISNGSNLQFKVEINIIADEGLPTALCSDPDLTDASERAATDPFGNTVTRRKLHDSGQNCSGDIFLFGLAKAESACYNQEKTCCLGRTGGLLLHQESIPGSADGCRHLTPSVGVGGSGQPDRVTGSTGHGSSIH